MNVNCCGIVVVTEEVLVATKSKKVGRYRKRRAFLLYSRKGNDEKITLPK